MALIVTARLVGASSRAAHPGYVHGAVLANGHAGNPVLRGGLLKCIDCGLRPRGTAIVGMRDQNLVPIPLMHPHDPGDVQAIDPRTARACIHREPGFKRVSLAWVAECHGGLTPV